jgi:hypothetical protein
MGNTQCDITLSCMPFEQHLASSARRRRNGAAAIYVDFLIQLGGNLDRDWGVRLMYPAVNEAVQG